jgi:hypothetical protein
VSSKGARFFDAAEREVLEDSRVESLSPRPHIGSAHKVADQPRRQVDERIQSEVRPVPWSTVGGHHVGQVLLSDRFGQVPPKVLYTFGSGFPDNFGAIPMSLIYVTNLQIRIFK